MRYTGTSRAPRTGSITFVASYEQLPPNISGPMGPQTGFWALHFGPLFCMRFLVVLCALAAACASLPPNIGTWSIYINALPAGQLPGVPLLGNGHFGIAMDSRSASVSAVGPGVANSLDFWLDTTSMWSCTECGGVDPDHDVCVCPPPFLQQ